MRAAADNSALLWRVCGSGMRQARLLTDMSGRATSDRRMVLARSAALGPPLTRRTEESLDEVLKVADDPEIRGL